MDFRQQLFRYRSYTPIPFLIVMMIFAAPSLSSLCVGFCIVMTGEFLRLWGVSIAGSETRTTGTVGGTYLITNGPFSYVRNPLYVGNMLMYFGIGIMSFALFPWFPLITLLYFLFQYSLIVSSEEEYLLKTFQHDFVKYCEAVPRFVPTLTRFSGATHEQPDIDWKKGIISEKRTMQAITLITTVLVVIWFMRA